MRIPLPKASSPRPGSRAWQSVARHSPSAWRMKFGITRQKMFQMVVSVFPGEGYVPQGYGYYYMQSLDAHGGWISTASDLVKFALAVDGKRGTALLKPASVKVMESSPRPKAVAAGAGNARDAFGLAFNSQAVGDGWEWSHAGALEGACASWLMRSPSGVDRRLPVQLPAGGLRRIFRRRHPRAAGGTRCDQVVAVNRSVHVVTPAYALRCLWRSIND